uniref:Uncharacterized protein n=2 Tax=Triticum urartu TaxID=4572 RepID=A0A8R7P8P1_TRIUA
MRCGSSPGYGACSATPPSGRERPAPACRTESPLQVPVVVRAVGSAFAAGRASRLSPMSCLRALLVGPLVEDEAKLAPLFQIQECNRVLRRDLSFQAQTPQPVICFYDGSKVLRHAAARSRKMQYLLSLIFWWKQTGGSDVQLRKRATLSAQLPRLAGNGEGHEDYMHTDSCGLMKTDLLVQW